MLNRVIFLHMPKTAGQSVHNYLKRAVGAAAICPARENFQLVGKSVAELSRYRVFSGHLDWALLDCVAADAFTFSILREPTDRILSFYFFLRGEATRLTPEQIDLPQNRGKKNLLKLSVDDYFCGGPPSIRNFLDSQYDNFYTHYFAGRTFDARNRTLRVLEREENRLTMDDIANCARDNLRSLSAVYRISELEKVEEDLARIGIRAKGPSLGATRANTGTGNPSTRKDELKGLGATSRSFDRIQSMVAFDEKLWADDSVFGMRGSSPRF